MPRREEIFALSPYKIFSLITITSCYRNGEEYIRTHPFIHLSTRFSDSRYSRLYQLSQILWTEEDSQLCTSREMKHKEVQPLLIMTCERGQKEADAELAVFHKLNIRRKQENQI